LIEYTKILRVKINIESIKEIFNEIDVDNNGFIDYTEFIASCIDSSLEWGEKYLKESFLEMDKNGDGKLSKEEIR